MRIQKWSIVTVIVIIITLGTSCANQNQYANVNNPGWFSINYPQQFDYTINNNSPIGLWAGCEVDFEENVTLTTTDTNGQNQSFTVQAVSISVMGYDADYSYCVNYDNTTNPNWIGKLKEKGKTLSVFNQTDELGQEVLIDYDVGNNRTITIRGSTFNSKTSLNSLTLYCKDMANSLKASPNWVSNWTGK
jgi:hypothetical protein